MTCSKCQLRFIPVGAYFILSLIEKYNVFSVFLTLIVYLMKTMDKSVNKRERKRRYHSKSGQVTESVLILMS